MPQGKQEIERLRRAGFSETEVSEWQQTTRGRLSEAGFSGDDIDKYFGVKRFDEEPLKRWFASNLTQAAEAPGEKKPEAAPEAPSAMTPKGQPKPAKTFLENLDAGFQSSVSGLLARGKMPSLETPADASSFARIASSIGTMAGDIPAMLAGAVTLGSAGATVGSAVPVVGTVTGAVLGAGAGAFALPAYMRESLVQSYEKGSVQGFRDWWDRVSSAFIAASKGAVTGATASGAGLATGAALATAAPVLRTTASVGAELATMVTVGKTLEGEIPEPRDFIEAAVLFAGFKGATTAAAKLRSVYAKTGVKPAEIVRDSQIDPTVKQDILAGGSDVPRRYAPLTESTGATQPETVTIKAPKTQTADPVLGPAEITAKVEKMPAPKAAEPAAAPVRTDAEKAVLSRVAHAEKKGALPTWDELYTNLMDDLHPIKQMKKLLTDGEAPAVKDDPYILARLSRGSAGKADQFVENGTFDFNTLKNTGPGLRQILKPFKEDRDGFRAYAVAARAVELDARGIESGVPLAEAKAVVQSGAKYQKAFAQLQTYQNEVARYLKDSGILDTKTYKTMLEANKSYVPFYRLMEEDAGRGAGGGLNVKNPIKQIKGSQREILDPIESIVRNTYFYVQLAERNRALNALRDLAAKHPRGGELMEKVPTPTKPIGVTEPEIAKFLEAHGIDSPGEGFTIFRPKHLNLAGDEIAVFTNGKRETYRVAPEVAAAVRNLDRESIGLFMRILAKPAEWLRSTVTLTPEFMERNLVRDQLTAAIFPTKSGVPVYDFVVGMVSFFKKDANYQNWLKGGGANSAMVSIDQNYIAAKVFDINRETGFIGAAHNVVRTPIQTSRVVSEVIENATRLGIYRRATKGATDAGTVLRGAFEAREGTLDFQRIGAKMRAVNAMTAFMNVGVQGIDRTARAFGEAPFRMTARVAAFITLPSLYLVASQYDDSRWTDIPRWQRDLFWIVLTEDNIYRIPKPFELGIIFGSLPERVLESYFTEDPRAFKDFQKTVLEGVTPNYIPTVLVPFIEQWANKSTFTGAPIIPADVEDQLPEFQAKPNTSEAAKLLGQFAAQLPAVGDTSFASPAVIENYVRAWTGGLGAYAIEAADHLLVQSGAVPDPVKPAKTLADIPFVKAFTVRHPTMAATQIQDFYDEYKKTDRVLTTIREQAKAGNFEAAVALLQSEKHQMDLVRLQETKQALTNQQKFIRLVYQNKDMSPDEKRQIIDGTYYLMIETARNGLAGLDAYRNALETKR